MPTSSPNRLILASRSPRRAELLRLLGVDFELVDATVDERVRESESAHPYVSRLARDKLVAARRKVPAARAILAADTAVSLDGEIFGKPASASDARRMLQRLSGRWHEVHTAVGLDAGGDRRLEVVMARVEFAPLDEAAITAYVCSGEPMDKAGAYGIQGLGGALVRRIEGSCSAIVGLPLEETRRLLDGAGIPHRLRPR